MSNVEKLLKMLIAKNGEKVALNQGEPPYLVIDGQNKFLSQTPLSENDLKSMNKECEDFIGNQVIADEHDHVVGENDHLLIGATQLSLHDIVEKAHHLDALCISSHVDRPSYSLIGQLGFIPEDLHLDAVEVSYRVPLDKALTRVPGIKDYPCVTASDAHFLKDIGKVWTEFILAAPTLEEIQMALAGIEGRRILNDTE